MSRQTDNALGQLIGDVAREAQRESAEMDEVISEFLGLNLTDSRCIDIVSQYGEQTAGQLAERLSLTTGAVTALIDRLEALGYVQRARDPKDRRKVIVKCTPLGGQLAWEMYRPFVGLWDRHSRMLTPEQWEAVYVYLQVARDLSKAYTAAVRALPRPANATLAALLDAADALAKNAKAIAVPTPLIGDER